jgi:uncharacterized protein with WD repeat
MNLIVCAWSAMKFKFTAQATGQKVTILVNLHFKNFNCKVLGKLTLDGVAEFSVSPGKNPCVAVFVPEKQGAPAIVRLYGMLSFNYPLSNKSFYKADTVKFIWNSIGKYCFVIIIIAVSHSIIRNQCVGVDAY